VAIAAGEAGGAVIPSAVIAAGASGFDRFLDLFPAAVAARYELRLKSWDETFAVMRALSADVTRLYERGGTFVISPGELSDAEQALYYGKAVREAAGLIQKIIFHGRLGPEAQRALGEESGVNLQTVHSLGGVSAAPVWHDVVPVLLSRTQRVESAMRKPALQIGIDFTGYTAGHLSTFDVAMAAFVQFVIGHGAINELKAEDVEYLNSIDELKRAGAKIDEERLRRIQDKLWTKLKQIPGLAAVISGFMNGTPNVRLSAMQHFVAQYRSELRIKAAA
jgi:hypothetical protein